MRWLGGKKKNIVQPARARARRQRVAASVAASLLVVSLAGSVSAAPTGGQISAGQGAIAQQAAVTTITQASNKLAINWKSFNIAANEKVRFLQPSASAIALNRVLGSNASQIYGQLSANGKVFLLNPNGVLFAKGSRVDAAGLVASTMRISDADFMAGKYTFTAGGSGSVVNQGELVAADGGYIALLAPEVRNEGLIAAKLGTVAVGAGSQATLDISNEDKIVLTVNQAAVNAAIENKHLIQADGGQVIMSVARQRRYFLYGA